MFFYLKFSIEEKFFRTKIIGKVKLIALYTYSLQDSCQNNSSSNILNDLLAEPITKTSTSWRLDNRRRESEQSLGQLIKTKAGANMAMKGKDFYGIADDQEESSIEEDFQNQPSGDEENADGWR